MTIDRYSPSCRPDGPCAMHHQWHDLLFLHWEVPAEQMQALIPPELTVDTFDGNAYVALVPFRISRIRHPQFVPMPGFSDFPEINVRTYVHRDGKEPGVWFFSLDAANPFACLAARALYRLPYFYAEMRQITAAITNNDSRPITRYRSRRIAPIPVPGYARIDYRPFGSPEPAAPGSLEHFFVERYLLYSSDGSQIYTGQVHHTPYLIQGAEIFRIDENLIEQAGITRPSEPPLVHFSRSVSVEVFGIKPIRNVPHNSNSGTAASAE